MILGSMGSKILAFLIVPFYTAVLTTEEYGISDLISTTVTLLFPFFSLIICESMMRFALDKENDPEEVWRIGCRVWLIGTIALILLSPIILLTQLKDYYWFVLLHYISYSVHSCVSYYVRGLNKVKIFALSGTIQSLAIVGFNLIFLLWFKLGIVGYLLARIIGAIISTIYIICAAKIYKYGFSIRKVNPDLRKKMLRYSIPMMPNSVSWWIANASDRYILSAFSGLSATGIYSVAYKIPTLVSTVSSLFGNAWKLSAVNDFGSEESKRFFSDIYSKLTAIMLISSSFLNLINKPLAHILFSKDFYQAWRCVPLLVLASVFHSYCDFLGSIYTSAYKTCFLVISTSMGALINIILNFCFIPKWGEIGAAVATVIGYGVVWIMRVLSSRKIMPIDIHYKRDILAYIIIMVQLVLASNSFKYEYIVSSAFFALLVVIMRKELIDIKSILLKRKA